MNVEKKLKQSLFFMQINKDYFLGNILQYLNKKFSNKVKTAGLGYDKEKGFSLYLNKQYFSSLSQAEIIKVLKHEVFHLIGKHYVRFKEKTNIDISKKLSKKEQEIFHIWNIACDISINQYIEGIEELGGYNPQNASKLFKVHLSINKKAEYYFDKIHEKYLSDINTQNIIKQSSCLDEHSFWEEISSLSEDELEYLNEQINVMISKAKEKTEEKGHLIPSGDFETHYLKPSLSKRNWINELKKYLQEDYNREKEKTYKRRNRRHAPPTIFKGYKKSIKPLKLVISIDTSASISHEQLELFFSEIKKIHIHYDEIWIIEADDKVNDVYKFKSKEEYKCKGRKGTLYCPSYEYVLNNKENIIGQGVKSLIYFGDNGHYDNDELKSLYNKNKKDLDILFVINNNWGEIPDYANSIII